jgi:hypothetical protein
MEFDSEHFIGALGYIGSSRGLKDNYYIQPGRLEKFLKDIPAAKSITPPKETPQSMIDNAIREALAQPAIDAEEERQKTEIERRLEMADQIGYNDNHEFGTVLKFDRRLGKDTEYSQAKSYTFVAFKAGDGNWYLTGQQQHRAGGWKWSALVEWMLTGDNTIENLQVAAAWDSIV